jgi:small conductance mechanosensitive channel
MASATPTPSPTSSAAQTVDEVLHNLESTPDFAQNWPDWAKWLIGVPLQVIIVVIVASVLVGVGHVVIRRLLRHLAKVPRMDQVLRNQPVDGERRVARAKTAESVLSSIWTFAIWIIAIAIILERLGVNVAVLVTSLGVVGVGLGLGAQTLIKDMIAGLFMLSEDQYGVGDRIDAGPATGEVIDLSLRVTTLRDDDGVLWYVPNGQITRIGNLTQGTTTP